MQPAESRVRATGRRGADFDAGVSAESESVVTRAYEQERARLSRELHDDIAQRLALLSADLGILQQRLTNASVEIREHVERLSTETATIGSDLNQIACGLHPAGLERLGLQTSIRHYCARLADLRRITVDLELGEIPAVLDMNAALCVYRIVQEALQNIVKHSGASHATISLTTVRGDLVLRIVDRGVGFNPQAMRATAGLGLISMRERARFIHAQLHVSSKPGDGTSIEVHVPIGQSFASASSE
jgi:signal transduction histidine kinase